MVGVILGGIVNMALITVGSMVVPAPPGVDVNDPDAVAASMHLYEARHFITPLVAHAAGTFSGAFVAVLVAASRPMAIALVTGAIYFMGGVTASVMIPAPAWFIAVDLIGAYFPFAWLGGRLGVRVRPARDMAPATSEPDQVG